MIASFFPVLVVAASAISASAAQEPLVVTNSRCATTSGTLSLDSVPTSSVEETISRTNTNYVVYTPVSTITPSPFSITDIEYLESTSIVTASQITDEFTETSTTFLYTTITTDSSTVEAISTVSSTITSGTTFTVPTPAGFTPASDSAQRPVAKRDAPRYVGGVAACGAKNVNNRKHGTCPTRTEYPQKVECTTTITSYAPDRTSTKQAKSTEVVTAPASSTIITSTSTLIATSTVLLEDASTTYTETEIVQVSSVYIPITTTTRTTTSVETIFTPSATYYAQCAGNNFIGATDWSDPTISDTNPRAFDNIVSVVNSSYDCCVLCAQTTGCQWSAWFGAEQNFCSLLQNSNNACSNSFFMDRSTDRYQASNGCANIQYGSG